MSLSRLILKNLRQKVVPPPPAAVFSQNLTERSLQPQLWSSELVHWFSSATNDQHDKSDSKEVSVSEGSKKSKLLPRRKRRRGLWWRNNDRDVAPSSLSDVFTRGVGNAFLEATENMSRLLENLSPSNLVRRFKEKDESYHIKYQMPGLSKDDVKITVEDGMLVIRGEHKEEEESDDDDEYWSAVSYGYYNTSLMLPEDAKVDEIKAEMKDGVLHIIIPKAEGKKKNVKEVPVR